MKWASALALYAINVYMASTALLSTSQVYFAVCGSGLCWEEIKGWKHAEYDQHSMCPIQTQQESIKTQQRMILQALDHR